MILRFINHIPAKNFKIVHYFGLLSNRLRGRLLPLVYQALNQPTPTLVKPLTYAQLFTSLTGNNPYECIVCHSKLVFSNYSVGWSHQDLLENRRNSMRKSRQK